MVLGLVCVASGSTVNIEWVGCLNEFSQISQPGKPWHVSTVLISFLLSGYGCVPMSRAEAAMARGHAFPKLQPGSKSH